MHEEFVSAAETPYRPASQLPLHKNDVIAEEAPYRPASQGEHSALPKVLNQPGGHASCVLEVEPVGHR